MLAGEYARRFAVRLRDVIGDGSVRALGRDADVAPGAIRRIIEGQTWPDLSTIAKLESTLGEVLWPTGVEGVRYETTTAGKSWWRSSESTAEAGRR
ncbi:hypothetical protein BIV01_10350 [Curtobacterium sp. MCBA15_013]|nr:hypothetical protein BIV01_10350 [Curtobacterium sp. MCBA15_013]